MGVLAADVATLAQLTASRANELVGEWPIDEGSFHAFIREAYNAYSDAVASLDGEAQDLLLADVRMLDVLVQIAHARAVAAKLAANGHELQVGPMARHLYEPNWQDIAQAHEKMLRGGARLGLRRQVYRAVRANRQLGCSRAAVAGLSRNIAWAVGDPDAQLCEWAKRRGLLMWWPDPAHLRATPNEGAVARATGAAADCARRVADAAHAIHGSLPESAITAWQTRLRTLASVSAAVWTRGVPTDVLVASAGNPFYRVVALAARRRGAGVVCAQHGHNAGHVDADVICFNDYAIATSYLCETPAALMVAKRRSTFRAIPPNRVIDFHVSGAPEARPAVEAASKGEPRNVMLLGFPHSPRRMYTDLGYLFMARIGLETRLAADLRRAGYRVLYKAHPEFAAAARPLIEPAVDEYLTAPFGTVLSRADLYLFTYPLTTTFGEALMTDRPIVMFDFVGQHWSPDERPLLEQRVAMVPARIEPGVQLSYDDAALHGALRRAPDLRSDAYRHVFLVGDRAA